MYILIGNLDNNISVYNLDDLIILDEICNLKHLEGENCYLIINKTLIGEDGIIKDKEIVFDEILLMVDIKGIFTNIFDKKIIEISKYYNIPLFILEK